MLAVPVAGRAWFRLNAEWVLPGVTVALVFLLAGRVPPEVRPWLVGLALFDLTVSAALIASRTRLRGERHPEGLAWVLVRGVLVAWLLLPLSRGWWPVAAALVPVGLGVVVFGLTRPLPAGAARLEGLERRIVSWSRVTPRSGLGAWLAWEGAVWAHLLGRARGPRGAAFRSSTGAGAEFTLLIFLSVLEAVPVHFLLAARDERAALVHLLVNVLGVLWCAGQLRALRALRARGVVLGERLHLNVGLLWTGSVALGDIAQVQAGAPSEAGVLPLHRQARANVTLQFARPVTLYGFLGRPQVTEAVSLSVDDPRAFMDALDAARADLMRD
ncbi:hypothetical protein [Deinococcus sp. JMULE3]|uniref:hypothetical protein n=1 Tax=Deinococcus sp. JMULE3 TaxID=2518341 RepID=UPI00157525F0|nr:hypothetical protein [Deinococcus sp. JMULE3]NTY01193.1 hypothetical protein [Deinococcus sp. JMULE3]